MKADSILIIEDELFVALDLEAICEDQGLHVSAMLDTALAVRDVREASSLALVDVNLVDGPTGPRAAWDLFTRLGMPSLFITANPDQIENPPPGAIGVIVKPFDRNTVAQVMKSVVANQALPRLEGFIPYRR